VPFPGVLDSVGDGGPVIVLGTGLTMMDVAVAVTDGNPAIRVLAVSRHGLPPLRHALADRDHTADQAERGPPHPDPPGGDPREAASVGPAARPGLPRRDPVAPATACLLAEPDRGRARTSMWMRASEPGSPLGGFAKGIP
jgi:hypothetical protein